MLRFGHDSVLGGTTCIPLSSTIRNLCFCRVPRAFRSGVAPKLSRRKPVSCMEVSTRMPEDLGEVVSMFVCWEFSSVAPSPEPARRDWVKIDRSETFQRLWEHVVTGGAESFVVMISASSKLFHRTCAPVRVPCICIETLCQCMDQFSRICFECPLLLWRSSACVSTVFCMIRY